MTARAHRISVTSHASCVFMYPVCVGLLVSQELSADNERLRMSASASREAAARQADELRSLQRDNTRIGTALVSCLSQS